jgi:hypothetical protein
VIVDVGMVERFLGEGNIVRLGSEDVKESRSRKESLDRASTAESRLRGDSVLFFFSYVGR